MIQYFCRLRTNMPILVKDYTWTESKDSVHITVPLKGVKRTNVGLTCTNEYLKANYPPFLFEVLLFKEIDDDKSSAKVRDGAVEFSLIKMDPDVWGRLQSENSDDKAFMLKKKLETVEYLQKKTAASEEREAKSKTENKRYTIKEMMKLEEGEKSRIESVKETERMNTEREMEEWKVKKQLEEESEKQKLQDEQMNASRKTLNRSRETREFQSQQSAVSGEIFADVQESPDDYENCEVEVNQHTGSRPREAGNIKFKFTPRVFPTPLRESKTAEEEQWLQKQAEARKNKEVDDPDLEEHEKDPEWLKDKGNKLFGSGNYAAAVNAYNLAIRLRPKMHTLYLNRAACHLKLRNFYKCIEDCSTAHDLLQPPVPANAKARLKAHIRRGTAFCELELYAEGLLDYNAALKIDPQNQSLKLDAQNIKDIIEKGDSEISIVSDVNAV